MLWISILRLFLTKLLLLFQILIGNQNYKEYISCFSFDMVALCSTFTAQKTIFSFSRQPEKMVFPKKLCWNIIFLVLLGKMIFPFPENMILHLRRKMKDDLSLKIHGNMIFSSNFLKIWFFQKVPPRHMIFLALSAKMVFALSGKMFDQTLLNVHAKNLVKVTGTGEVKGRKGPSTLRKLSFKFRH